MVKRATESARIGWYHRVKLEGLIEAGDAYRLVERPQPEWTIARVFRARVHPAATPANCARSRRCPDSRPSGTGTSGACSSATDASGRAGCRHR